MKSKLPSKKIALLKFFILMILMVFVAFVFSIFLNDFISSIVSIFPRLRQYTDERTSYISAWVTGVMVFSSFLTAIVSYLNKGIGEKKKDSLDGFFYNKFFLLKKKVDEIEERSFSDVAINLTDDERRDFISQAKKRIIGNTIKLAEDSLKSDIASFNKNSSLHKIHTDMVYRLEAEIENLNRRGGVNLGIGSTIALSGILALAYFVYNAQNSIADGVNLLISFIPKLSFVLVIELFAYFFLKLYKNGFDEIKFYQNEITNIEMKVMGIKYMQGVQSDEVMKELSMHLMRTERNFILEKGQTTTSLEKDKLQESSDARIVTVFSEILKKLK
ncbi:hypothetical protein [Pantoea sp. EEL5]|uniref:hypothetical protein n=1 Tax=Pantoea sp. EEL5 TaxID=3416806 RepID=UPI003CF4ED21